MGHGGWVRDQAFPPAQRLGQREVFETIDERLDLRHLAVQLEAQHRAETLLLARRQSMAGMAGQAGVVDLAHRRMAVQSFGDADRILLVLAQPHRSEEHTSELQSLMRISYAVFC